MGFTVVALSRSDEKRERVRQLGASHCFDPEDAQWRLAVKRVLGQRRVDLAIDNIAGKLLPEVIDTLDNHGRVSLVGRLAGPVPSFNTAALFFRRIRQQVLDLLAATNTRPLVDSVLPFEQLPQAFKRLAAGPMGKVLVKVDPSFA
jgi:NADPH2:quinone reductase